MLSSISVALLATAAIASEAEFGAPRGAFVEDQFLLDHNAYIPEPAHEPAS